MEEKTLNEQESIALISRMIQNSKKNLQMGSGNSFLLWGYLCAGTALLVYVLVTLTKLEYANFAWLLIPVVGFPLELRLRRKRVKPVTTYIDKVLGTVWRNVGFGILAWMVVLFIYPLVDEDWDWSVMQLMVPFSLIMCAAGAMFSGSILRDRWMEISAGAAFIVALPTVLSYILESLTPIYPLYALCFVLMMVIPGHRLNRKAKDEKHV
ncbi:MAG: hypothetical protein LBN29_05745 [Mediterranea sp.]|jgi:hypothetical protein|nr:hypothetical protein [Mediterranea sp.]